MTLQEVGATCCASCAPEERCWQLCGRQCTPAATTAKLGLGLEARHAYNISKQNTNTNLNTHTNAHTHTHTKTNTFALMDQATNISCNSFEFVIRLNLFMLGLIRGLQRQ